MIGLPSSHMDRQMSEFTFSRFVYCDTNILSHLAKNEHLWPRLFEFLDQGDLTLGLSGAQIAELSDAKSLHQSLARLFVTVPSALLKNPDTVLAEEVRSHPQGRSELLLMYPLNAILLEEGGFEKLSGFLSSTNLSEARKDQLKHAQQMAGRHAQLKGNFPPSKTGNYIREQADEFAWMEVMQGLASTHRGFLARFQNNIKDFHPEIFLSIRLFAHVIFYKYYLGRREPKGIPDFGDLGHMFLIAYCDLAIMERDLCNVLNQIKLHHDTLASTVVRDIDFFGDWGWQ